LETKAIYSMQVELHTIVSIICWWAWLLP